MTTAPMTSEAISPAGMRSDRLWIWLWGGLILVLTLLLFRNFTWRMLRIALADADWMHAWVVPLMSGFFIYLRREELQRMTMRAFWPGLIVMCFGIFSFAWWIFPGRNDMLQGYSMIIAIFGMVLFLFGPRMMTVLWLPVMYLVFAVKVSDRIWEQIAWKMQVIASQSAVVVLKVMGIDATISGTTIELYSGLQNLGKLNVEEACSGLRSLMAFIALGVAVAYVWQRPWWHRVVLVFSTVPVALAVNIGRVTSLGLLYKYADPSYAKGDFHTFVGMLMLIPGLGVYLLIGWILDRLVIYEKSAENKVVASTMWGINGRRGPDRGDLGNPMWAIWGFVGGAGILLLLGLNFALLLRVLREQLVDQWISKPQAMVLLTIGVAALLVLIYLVKTKLIDANLHADVEQESTRTRSATTTLEASWASASSVGESIKQQSSTERPRHWWTYPKTTSMHFGMVVGALLVCVLGLHAVVWATRLVLIKEPVPMREPLFLIGERLGDWELLQEDPPLPKEVLEALGTHQYISRVYRNRKLALNAGGLVRLHVAYYTGTPDTVPHVPDRCFVAGGMRPIDIRQVELTMDGPNFRREGQTMWAESRLNPQGVRVPNMQIDATLFTFAPPERGSMMSNVMYFFVSNGRYLPTPDHVRLSGFDPRDRFAYYCKVEVMLPGVGDRDSAKRLTSEFLSVAMPEILACLPDWVEVSEGRWPPPHPTSTKAEK